MFVKICGTTNEEDALLAVAMGADAIGFIFAPSPRQVSSTVVADIVKRLPPEILTVGVFRNESPPRVVEIVNGTGLRGAQLHGRETPDQARWVRERVPFLIQAFSAGDPALADAGSYGADAIIIDSPSPGSGQVFDWRLADGAPDSERLILAGGLDAENVAQAIALVHPWGVDVATGVERRPGRKHAEKVRAFVSAAKGGTIDEPPPDPFDEDSVLERASAPYDWQDDL